MHLTTHKICSDLKNLILESHGPENTPVTETRSFQNAAPGSIVFVNTVDELKLAEGKGATAIVTPLKLLRSHRMIPEVTYLGTLNTGLTMVAIKNLFQLSKETDSKIPNSLVHPTAIVAGTAKVDKSVQISAYAVIGENVRIDQGVRIGPHCVIEDDVIIGEYTRLEAHSFLGHRTRVGKNCVVRPHSCIGSEGFGLAHDDMGRHFHIPQTGIVVLEDHVDVGAHVTIDRATFDETRVGEGTKIDSQVHIAHNCKVGRHSIFAGDAMMAGSSTVGNHCVLGGSVRVSDHVHVTDKVQLAGLTAVSGDISEPGNYGGRPLQKIRDYLKTTASLVHLPRLRRDVNDLLKNAGLDRKDDE